ncbi:MAG TPA: hypothetical protein VGI45_11335 [Terracidiphilus sp.]|jgi:hypothetical protein
MVQEASGHMVTIWIKRKHHHEVTCTDYEAEVVVKPEVRTSQSFGWERLGRKKKTSHPDSPQISVKFRGACKSSSDYALQPPREKVEAGITISAAEAVRLGQALILAATNDVRQVRLSPLERRFSLRAWKLTFRGAAEPPAGDE